MKKDCWICNQRGAWNAEKLNTAIAAAKLQANEQGETLAIIKEGCIYKAIPAATAIRDGSSVIQYISKYQ